MPRLMETLNRGTRMRLAAAALLAVGVAGGASAVSLTRPGIEMAPTTPTAIARLSGTSGVVTVKGRVVEIFGDRFVLQDATGRTMIDAGRNGDGVTAGATMTVQGRYDNGQLRASYLVDPNGRIVAGGPPPHGPGGPRAPGGPGHDGPPPPPPGGANLAPPGVMAPSTVPGCAPSVTGVTPPPAPVGTPVAQTLPRAPAATVNR
ncbi:MULTISPECIES: hypothetical protein [Sphingomonas]|jgi:hypothetical protein|uniref:hypothetical protein n=1 Tax=Sphingomonas TaxID=13687 RepID=UPI000FE1467B|nr:MULTISPECIES: hypothetical protein [unclassified Sphingomonas]MBD8470995.1 hypothetical protein [Sphingomonas sp. CFBP 8765]MDY1006763.1 hypothetical protein [Sphingomonas sp. CFBP9019]